MKFFKRGFVAKAELPRLNIPEKLRTSFIMEGSHYVIVLHHSDNRNMDSRSALVMPITSAQAEVNRSHRQGRDILLSYVPIK